MACSDGDIRLEGGNSIYDGRIEVCQNQVWGGICDNSWNNIDANVACHQLGFSSYSKQELNISDAIMTFF